MFELPEELGQLNGYTFGPREYTLSHSLLTLHAVSPKNASIKFSVFFDDVHYIQMPASWKGSFEIGSDLEREELARKCKFSLQDNVQLYKSNDNLVLILGRFAGIKPRDRL